MCTDALKPIHNTLLGDPEKYKGVQCAQPHEACYVLDPLSVSRACLELPEHLEMPRPTATYLLSPQRVTPVHAVLSCTKAPTLSTVCLEPTQVPTYAQGYVEVHA